MGFVITLYYIILELRKIAKGGYVMVVRVSYLWTTSESARVSDVRSLMKSVFMTFFFSPEFECIPMLKAILKDLVCESLYYSCMEFEMGTFA